MRIAVLGDLEVYNDDGEQVLLEGTRRKAHRVRNLICVLASAQVWRGERAVPDQLLQELIWDWDPHRDNITPLRQVVSRARGIIGDRRLAALQTDRLRPLSYEITRNPGDACDAETFVEAVALGGRARDADELERAAQLFDQALNMWRGEGRAVLPDFPPTPTMHIHLKPLYTMRSTAIEACSEIYLALGRPVETLTRVEGYLRGDQATNEHLHALHLLALYRVGRREEALKAYGRAVQILNRAEIEVGTELQRMRDQISRHDPQLAWRAPAVATPVLIPTQAPTVNGVTDYTQGGKDNYAADRQLVTEVHELTGGTDTVELPGENRACLARMVRFMAKQGIRQFVDLGCGPPEAQGRDVPKMVGQVLTNARVLMIDNHPVVAAHVLALLADGERVSFRQLGIEDVTEVLYEARSFLDFGEPVGFLCANALQYVGPPDAPVDPDLGTGWLVSRLQKYVDALPDGSYIALTHLSDDGLDPRIQPLLDSRNPDAKLPMHLRTPEQIERMFCGLPLVEPYITDVGRWRPTEPHIERPMRIIGGVAYKGPRRD